jgi:hypothetical protein
MRVFCELMEDSDVDRRIIELALETLAARKAAIEAEIAALKDAVSPKPATPRVAAAAPKSAKRVRTASSRKAQSEKMKVYWAKRRAEAAKQATPKPKAR